MLDINHPIIKSEHIFLYAVFLKRSVFIVRR